MASPSTIELDNPHEDLLYGLKALHSSSKYTDLVITCGYKQFYVHKAIVCPRSAFLDGACSSSFLEGNSGVIDLSEDDEDAVEQMIHFFYHLDYLNEAEQKPVTAFRHRAHSDSRRKLRRSLNLSNIEDPLLSQAGCYTPEEPQSPPEEMKDEGKAGCPSEKPRTPKMRAQTPPLVLDSDSDCESAEEDGDYVEPESHLLLHTRVYALAEKYDIPSLKKLARSYFEQAMACYYDSPEFPSTIEEVYCSTIDSDRGLRDIVLEAFKSHPQLASTQDVYEVIRETPSLALELFKVERGIPV